MDYRLRVRRVKCIGNLDAYVENFANAQRAILKELAQGLALQKFHDKEGPAFLFADIVDHTNIGVIEGAGRAGFAAKSFQRFPALMEIIRQEFHRNTAPQASVGSAPNDSHPSAAQGLIEPVMAEQITGLESA